MNHHNQTLLCHINPADLCHSVTSVPDMMSVQESDEDQSYWQHEGEHEVTNSDYEGELMEVKTVTSHSNNYTHVLVYVSVCVQLMNCSWRFLNFL